MKSGLLHAFALASCLGPLATRAADPFAENVRSTDPLPPEEQQKKFHLPPGFEIQLVAAEPDLRKPMNMAFDAQGRLWITESREYPFPGPVDKPGRDTVRIFSDFDEHGRARKVQIFADGLNIPIGIYPFRSATPSTINHPPSTTWKAIVWSIPDIWLMEDTDGDGQADKREVLYGPFDHTRDTHGNQASFRRGFDGWLYATHGFNNDSHVKGRDGHEVHLNSGNTYRMQLDGSRIEHHTWGQVNPYGLAWDPLGNLYSSDCHSAPVYQLLAGGYYPSFGKPHDGLGFAPVLMEHSHGSTAIDGMLYYADDLWPEEFKNNVFIGNVMTSRVNRDRLTFGGSTPKANELDDFVKCDDPWFRPVDNQLGPDGAFYIADFYNRIIGHYEVPLTHPGRDRERGRIWRVVYKGEKTKSEIRNPKLPNDLEGLIAELGSPNLTRRLLAMNSIADLYGHQAVAPLKKHLGTRSPNGWGQVHAMWLLQRLGALDDGRIAGAVRDRRRELQVHAMRILTERGLQLNSAPQDPQRRTALKPALQKLAVTALSNPDALVQRCAAEALGAWPAFDNLRPLLDLRHRVEDAPGILPAETLGATRAVRSADTHLLYVLRKAIRDQLNHDEIFRELLARNWSGADLGVFADVAVAVKSPLAGTFLLRQLERTAVDRETAGNWLRHAARYAPIGDMDQLAAFARKQLPGGRGAALYEELERQFALFKSVDEGLQQRGAARPRAIHEWGAELANRFFHSLDPYHSWNYVPYESSPTADPWDFEKRPCADGQVRRLTSSFPHGEQLTGVLRSPQFEIPERLSFWLCGHNGPPGQTDHTKNRIRLRVVADRSLPNRSGSDSGATGGTPSVLREDRVVAETFPPRSDTARRVTWDLATYRGQMGYVEAIDGETGGAYAWMAFGGFEPELSQLRPSEFAPRRMGDWLTAATDVAVRLQLKEFAPLLARATTPRSGLDLETADPNVLSAFARGWVSLVPDEAVSGLAAALSDANSPALYREALAEILAGQNSSVAREAVVAALKTASSKVQERLAYTLAGTSFGAETLLRAIESGSVSPRVIQSVGMKNRLQAAKPDGWEGRYAKLTKDLPPADEARGRLIAERRLAYSPAAARAGEGARVFEQNCAVCHRVDGTGGLVGPQLDGIGNRGLERLLEDILDPNRNVDHAFRSHTITLKAGEIVSGLPRREEGELLILADSTGKEISIPKQEIAERRESDLSLMPENLGEVIPPQDFNDLMAFLLSQRGSPAK